MKTLLQRLSDELIDECRKQNKKCVITITDMDKSSHYKIISYVTNRVAELYEVRLPNLRNWKKSEKERAAKKMIVFILINRLSVPIKDLAEFLGISSQSISYISLNPYGTYRIENFENFVHKIEDELKQNLYLSS